MPIDADRPAAGSHRQEQPLGAGQRVRAAAGRAVIAPGPVGGGQIGLVELVFRRIARLHGQDAVLRQQQHHPHLQHQRGLIGGRPQHVVQRRGARELAAEGVERFRRAHPADRGVGLGAHPRGDVGYQKRDQHEEEERRNVGRIGDGEGVDRRQKEEIVAQRSRRRSRTATATGHSGPRRRPRPSGTPDRRSRCRTTAGSARPRQARRRRTGAPSDRVAD